MSNLSFIKRCCRFFLTALGLILINYPSASECSRDEDCGGDMDCSGGWCVDREQKAYVPEETPVDKWHFGVFLAVPIPVSAFADDDLVKNKWDSNHRNLLESSSTLPGYGGGLKLDFPVIRDLYFGVKTLAVINKSEGKKITEYNGDTSYTKVGSWYNISFLPSIKYMPNLASIFEIYFSAQAGLNIAFAPGFEMGVQSLNAAGNIRNSRIEVALENPAYTFAASGGAGLRFGGTLNIGISFLYLGEPEFKAELKTDPGSATVYDSSKPLTVLLVTAGMDF